MLRRLSLRRSLIVGLLVTKFVLISVLVLRNRGSASLTPAILAHPYFFRDFAGTRDPHQQCQFPDYHPLDSSVWPYFRTQGDLGCGDNPTTFTYIDDEGRLLFNGTTVQHFGYTVGSSSGAPGNLHCHWEPIVRDEDDEHIHYGTELPLPDNGTNLPADTEFLRVRCRNNFGLSVHEAIHARVSVRPRGPSPDPPHPFSVLIFGVESMSRLAFVRLLPRTYRFLTETLGATVLRGMVKVGDNTHPNLLALLTGDLVYGGHLPVNYSSFDEHPLIWRNYSAAGYATLWAEDYPKFGLFTYLDRGFRRPPTDHYLRPLWLAVQQSYAFIPDIVRYCFQDRPKHMLQVDYLLSFVRKYRALRRPFFAFSFLVEISHNYIAPVSAADAHFEAFFRDLRDGGHLDDTVLLVMSDHGHRFDSIRSTRVGYTEERMPFYSIYIPDKLAELQKSAVDNLVSNRGRLATHLDMHETLADLFHFFTASRPLGQAPPRDGALGQSLFREVPANRTCKDASIPDHYCVCGSETTIPTTDTKAQSAAAAIIGHINSLLGDSSDKCAELKLSRVLSAILVHSNEGEKVRVTVEAEPSRATFEATVLQGSDPGKNQILGDVSRTNMYAGQSDCIQHVILRKFCYCKNL